MRWLLWWLPLFAASLLLSLGNIGCTSAVAVWPEPQSRVISPAEKIVRLGQAEGSISGFDITFSGVADFIDPKLGEEAVREAIESKRADLLTDYSLSLYLIQLTSPFNLTLFGVQVIPTIWIFTWTAEGSAARLEGVEQTPPAPGGKS
jgi:hypothetical protein